MKSSVAGQSATGARTGWVRAVRVALWRYVRSWCRQAACRWRRAYRRCPKCAAAILWSPTCVAGPSTLGWSFGTCFVFVGWPGGRLGCLYRACSSVNR